ncbi:MAG: ribosome biogenesis GTPase YqeH [Bacilli bacterium]|nr:ribosome biogenesis GTPase YqeH [Bacilli bacterium]MDD3422005.1 ribosome biogenesis GTPase YqeH [Bacilli bacterium]
MKAKICSGCGAVLQSLDPDKQGYIPSNVELHREEPLCQRCFKLRHYNENSISINNEEFLKTIDIPTKDNIILYVMDAFNFHGSLIKDINKMAKDSKLIILVNKIDVLPKSLNENKFRRHIISELNEAGIKFDDLQSISARKNRNFDDLLNGIIKTYPEKNIYLIGAANVGKSSIINTLLHDYENNTDKMVTTSYFPGTTLQLVKVPFLNDKYLYDTPGIYNVENIYHYVDSKNLRALLPTKEIKPLVFQLKPGQSLYLGSLCRLDFIKSKNLVKTSFIVYASNNVKVNRTKLDNNADEKFNKAILNPDYSPKATNIKSITDFTKHPLLIQGQERTSICINGLAFIDVVGQDVVCDVYVPKGVGVQTYPSFIGGEENAKR